MQEPPYFSGSVADLVATGEAIVAPFDGKKETKVWEFFLFPLYIVDLPFSFIADVLYIPSDHEVDKTRRSQDEEPGEQTMDPVDESAPPVDPVDPAGTSVPLA